MKVFPPKRRMRIYAFALVAFGSAGALFCHFSEPTYKGESLSEWLSQSGERYLWMPIASKTTNEEMVEAVTHIGPKGIPTLLKMLQRQQPRWQHVVENWLSSLPWLPQPNFEDRSDEENYGAVVGFGILKNAADSAIPELEQMLYRTNTCERAAAALHALGPHTTPILLKGATKDESLVRQSSIYALYLFPTNTFDLTDQMQRWRKDTNEIVAYHATGWLWEHRPASERLELVRDALKDGRRMPVQIGLFLLPKLGAEATNAIAEVTNLFFARTLHRGVLRTATNFLKQVDPAAAAAFGIDTNPPPIKTNSFRGRPGRRSGNL